MLITEHETKAQIKIGTAARILCIADIGADIVAQIDDASFLDGRKLERLVVICLFELGIGSL